MILKLPITIMSPLGVLRAWASELRGRSFLTDLEFAFKDYELVHVATGFIDAEAPVYTPTVGGFRAYFARYHKAGSRVLFKTKFSIDFLPNPEGTINSLPISMTLSLPRPVVMSQVLSQVADVSESAYNDAPFFMAATVVAQEYFSGSVGGSPYLSRVGMSATARDDSPDSFAEIASGVEMTPRDNFMVEFVPSVLSSIDLGNTTDFISTLSFVVHGFYETYEG